MTCRRSSFTGRLRANMTPMIDVTFLLVIFFVVVSQIVDRQSVPMDLPQPSRPVSSTPSESRFVVNLLPDESGGIASMVAGGEQIPGDALGVLGDAVSRALRASPRPVQLRADRGTDYAAIHDVLETIRRAAPRVDLQLVVEGGRPRGS